MSEIDSQQHPFLYRAIGKKGWLNQWSAAFRLKKGETSLSVILKADCSASRCEALLNTCFGEFKLTTQGISDKGLRVMHDLPNDPEYREIHANVFGLPEYGSDDKLIEDCATALAELVAETNLRS